MSRATKKKHVSREVLEDFVVPTASQKIVRVGLMSPMDVYNTTFKLTSLN